MTERIKPGKPFLEELFHSGFITEDGDAVDFISPPEEEEEGKKPVQKTSDWFSQCPHDAQGHCEARGEADQSGQNKPSQGGGEKQPSREPSQQPTKPKEPVVINDEKKADDWGFYHYEHLSQKLDENNKDAIERYCNNSGVYSAVNSYLRYGEEAEGGVPEDVISSLDGVFSVASSPENIMVFRGMSGRMLAKLLDTPVGGIFQDKGYVSTSLVQDKADEFVDMGTLVKIIVPKGGKAVYTDAVFGSDTHRMMHENELLIKRDSRFRVVDNPDEWNITLELLNE